MRAPLQGDIALRLGLHLQGWKSQFLSPNRAVPAARRFLSFQKARKRGGVEQLQRKILRDRNRQRGLPSDFEPLPVTCEMGDAEPCRLKILDQTLSEGDGSR